MNWRCLSFNTSFVALVGRHFLETCSFLISVVTIHILFVVTAESKCCFYISFLMSEDYKFAVN